MGSISVPSMGRNRLDRGNPTPLPSRYSFLKTVGREQKTDTTTSQQYGGILQVSKTCQALGLHPGEFLIIR